MQLKLCIWLSFTVSLLKQIKHHKTKKHSKSERIYLSVICMNKLIKNSLEIFLALLVLLFPLKLNKQIQRD